MEDIDISDFKDFEDDDEEKGYQSKEKRAASRDWRTDLMSTYIMNMGSSWSAHTQPGVARNSSRGKRKGYSESI